MHTRQWYTTPDGRVFLLVLKKGNWVLYNVERFSRYTKIPLPPKFFIGESCKTQMEIFHTNILPLPSLDAHPVAFHNNQAWLPQEMPHVLEVPAHEVKADTRLSDGATHLFTAIYGQLAVYDHVFLGPWHQALSSHLSKIKGGQDPQGTRLQLYFMEHFWLPHRERIQLAYGYFDTLPQAIDFCYRACKEYTSVPRFMHLVESALGEHVSHATLREAYDMVDFTPPQPLLLQWIHALRDRVASAT